MKKIILIIGLALLAIVNVQAQDTMYIYRKNNPLLKVPLSDIDSAIFYQKPTVTDIDGNVYNVITIGGQVWMKENLKVTRLKDGTAITLVTDATAWADLATQGYCFYNNSTLTGATYGALYNWYTVNTSKLCPTDWHVPNNGEWTNLATYLGGTSTAGGKLKAIGNTYWQSPNTGADNSSGFTALPGGIRGIDGGFYLVGSGGCWWSFNLYSFTTAYTWRMNNLSSNVDSSDYPKQNGFSVRCLKD